MFTKSIIALMLLIAAPIAFAHGGGESFEENVDGYLIDIGYNTDEFQAGQAVLFDFSLETSSEYNVEYTDIWVRILKDGKAVFASGIHNSSFGGARMTYTFPEEGKYELSVRYQKGSEKLVSASFPLTVLPADEDSSTAGNSNILSILFGILGIGIGFGIATAVGKK